MKKVTTSVRLKEIMRSRNLRQVDILDKTRPYCEKHKVKMNRSDISQYVSGLVEPGQEKLAILGMALNVNEAWLMGYDVPMDRDYIPGSELGISSQAFGLLSTFDKLNSLGKKEALKRVEELSQIPKYVNQVSAYLLPDAAHELEGASQEDKDHDDAIMDDDNF